MRAPSPPSVQLYPNREGFSVRNRSGPRVSSFFRPTGSSSQASALTRPATEVQVNRAGPIQTPKTSPSFSCHHPLRDKVLLLLTSTFPQVAGHKAEVAIQNKEKNTCTYLHKVYQHGTQQYAAAAADFTSFRLHESRTRFCWPSWKHREQEAIAYMPT